MQIRRTRPDSVQRLPRVAIGLAEVSESVLALRIERRLRSGEDVGVRVQPEWIGTNVAPGFDRACFAAAETMALRALLIVDCLSARRREPGRWRMDIWEAARSRSNRECVASWRDPPSPASRPRRAKRSDFARQRRCCCHPSGGASLRAASDSRAMENLLPRSAHRAEAD